MIAVLSHDDCGPSIMVCETPIVFENTEIPIAAESVIASYGGNGAIKVDIKDPENCDYTHYNVFIVDEYDNIVEDAMGYYAVGSNITLGGNGTLIAGRNTKCLFRQ